MNHPLLVVLAPMVGLYVELICPWLSIFGDNGLLYPFVITTATDVARLSFAFSFVVEEAF